MPPPAEGDEDDDKTVHYTTGPALVTRAFYEGGFGAMAIKGLIVGGDRAPSLHDEIKLRVVGPGAPPRPRARRGGRGPGARDGPMLRGVLTYSNLHWNPCVALKKNTRAR